MARKRKKLRKRRPFKIFIPFPLIMGGLAACILSYWVFSTGFMKHFRISAPSQQQRASENAVFNDKPKIIFVIDDIGYNLEQEANLQALGKNVVYAILPLLPYSKHFARQGRAAGADIILHMPLETVDGTVPGRGLITRNMSPLHVLEMLETDLGSVPGHIGANNHMGSLGTSDPDLMRTILKEMKRRHLIFLDSFTTPESVVSQIGQETGLPVVVRDIFLDNVDAKAPIRAQIRKLKYASRQKGYAIAIGHYRKNTLEVLREDIPKLREEGFEILSLRELMRYLEKKKK